MTETKERDKLEHARACGQASFDDLAEKLENLKIATGDEAFEEAAEELAKAADYELVETIDEEDGSSWAWRKLGGEADEIGYGDEESAWLACCVDNGLRPDEDDARRAIDEDPLSVEVRSGWTIPGDEMEAEEFCILLTTGGPAVRIVGDLDRGQPTRAYMQVQDWFTQWTDFFPKGEDVDETLLEYAQQFYFGE